MDTKKNTKKQDNMDFMERLNITIPQKSSNTSSKENIELDEIKNEEEVKQVEVTKSNEPTKKAKTGKNPNEFIENIINRYKEMTEPSNEKTHLQVTPQIHSKLKMVSSLSKVNLYELTNAIINAFIEDNKDDINTLVKKMSI